MKYCKNKQTHHTEKPKMKCLFFIKVFERSARETFFTKGFPRINIYNI